MSGPGKFPRVGEECLVLGGIRVGEPRSSTSAGSSQYLAMILPKKSSISMRWPSITGARRSVLIRPDGSVHSLRMRSRAA